VLNVMWIYYCVYTYTDPELIELSSIWLSIAPSSSLLSMSRQNQEYKEIIFNNVYNSVLYTCFNLIR
jgi:hypothetical protein